MVDDGPGKTAPHIGITVEQAQDQPAIYSNKFHITVSDTHVRLLFAQMFLPEEKPHVQANIVMNHSDAYELGRLIMKLIGRIRAAQQESEKPNVD